MAYAKTPDHSEGIRSRSALREYISGYLKTTFSKKIKRLIFLSSFVGLIKNIKTADKEMLLKLNDILKLAHNQEAIAFPIYINSWLWEKCNTDQVINLHGQQVQLSNILDNELSKEDYKSLADYTISHAPKWLVYGNLFEISKDLELLLKGIKS